MKITDDYGNNALEQNNIKDLMSEVISKMSQDIEQKRLDLITSRLKELGLEIDFKTEAKKIIENDGEAKSKVEEYQKKQEQERENKNENENG